MLPLATSAHAGSIPLLSIPLLPGWEEAKERLDEICSTLEQVRAEHNKEPEPEPMGKGFNNRNQGGFGFPAEDIEEPARTERLLARPFAWRRTHPADQLQQRAGAVLFRVNGGSCLGIGYRLIIVGFNMAVGALAGVKPLLEPGSAGAYAQCATVFGMQLGLALLCFTIAPDADRFFSLLAGLQFLAEGLSNACLFVAPFLEPAYKELMQTIAFDIGLIAVFVPIMQLLEQRVITPTIGILQNKGCNPRVLGGALIVLVASLPGAIMKAVAAFGGGGGGGGGPNVGQAIADCFQKIAILFGRSAASGDIKKGQKTKVRKRLGGEAAKLGKDKAVAASRKPLEPRPGVKV